MITITDARTEDLPLVRALFAEYAASLSFDLGFQNFSEELANLPGDYANPRGCILLAFDDSTLAGCVALKNWHDNVAEMKRLFVRPTSQRKGIGRKLTAAVIERARSFNYRKVRLDTVPEMISAISMYESMGFRPIPPYRENPVPGTLYLELVL